MLPIGSRVLHPYKNGHGEGTVIAHNNVPVNEYFKEKPLEAITLAGQSGLIPALVGSLYDGTRYPNVIKWDNGYQDVYADSEVQLISKGQE